MSLTLPGIPSVHGSKQQTITVFVQGKFTKDSISFKRVIELCANDESVVYPGEMLKVNGGST